MQVTAQLNYLRIAPRKIRLLAGLLKGLDVEQAEAQLSALVKRGQSPVAKLLHSAVKNAENNFQLPKHNLFVKALLVDEGIKLKRFRPSAMGQAKPIQRKTSHLKLILAERVPGLKHTPAKLAPVTPAETAAEAPADKAAETVKTPATNPRHEDKNLNRKSGRGLKNFGRRFFQRKAI